jgi:hypothetical protein
MHIKWLKHGRNSTRSAINYLLAERDHKREERERVEVLRGNPEAVAEVGEGLDFEWKYRSGVIAFAPEDNPSDAQIDAVLDDFEKAMSVYLPDQDISRLAWTAVRHDDKDSCHIHVVVAKVDLASGYSVNVSPPGWQGLYDKLRDKHNAINDWARPDDPQRKRMAKFDPSQHQKSLKQLKSELLKAIENAVITGAIEDRQSLLGWLEDVGLSVERQTKKGVSVSFNGGKNIRLSGDIFSEQFNGEIQRATAREDAARTRAVREDYARASEAFRAEIEQRIKRNKSRLDQRSAARQVPANGADNRESTQADRSVTQRDLPSTTNDQKSPSREPRNKILGMHLKNPSGTVQRSDDRKLPDSSNFDPLKEFNNAISKHVKGRYRSSLAAIEEGCRRFYLEERERASQVSEIRVRQDHIQLGIGRHSRANAELFAQHSDALGERVFSLSGHGADEVLHQRGGQARSDRTECRVTTGVAELANQLNSAFGESQQNASEEARRTSEVEKLIVRPENDFRARSSAIRASLAGLRRKVEGITRLGEFAVSRSREILQLVRGTAERFGVLSLQLTAKKRGSQKLVTGFFDATNPFVKESALKPCESDLAKEKTRASAKRRRPKFK